MQALLRRVDHDADQQISKSEFKEMIEQQLENEDKVSSDYHLSEKALTYIPPKNREQKRLSLVSDFVSFIQHRLQVVNSLELWKQTLFSLVQFDLEELFSDLDFTKRGYLI